MGNIFKRLKLESADKAFLQKEILAQRDLMDPGLTEVMSKQYAGGMQVGQAKFL